MSDKKIPLATMIDHLRQELMTAMAMGHDEPLRFELDEVKLEAQVAVSREGKGKAGVKFWVVEAGAEGSMGSSRTQKITLTLKPQVEGDGIALLGAELSEDEIVG